MTHGVFDLPKLFVGSEGTLGVFSEATIRPVDRPRSTVTGMIHFRHLEEMGEAVHHLLRLDPLALEVMDANTLDLIGRSRHRIPDDAAATLLIEFDQAETTAELRNSGKPAGTFVWPAIPWSRPIRNANGISGKPASPLSHVIPVRRQEKAHQLRR